MSTNAVSLARLRTRAAVGLLRNEFPAGARPALASLHATVLQRHQHALRAHSTQSTDSTTSHITLKPSTPGFHQSHLAAQRLRRPVSPHITIWRWQSHMLLSALQRNTGLLFAGPLYLFLIAHGLSPLLGSDVGISSAGVVAAVAALPGVVVWGGKAVAAWGLSLHAVQGIHEVVRGLWPAWGLRSKELVVKTSLAVFVLSGMGTVGLLWAF
ncbi:uncharacterized protein HMPREF1541_07000 [Cyphellophora europaea CBS 101466]|uniref:Succinate dehydrogenase, cytochrome b556 subunit n=1 Tax=Cyphellophora europaea (strain CBS 101466) TaxID=1220924 RepID=W2RT98_CYPE1|nr:uncharacterized protein HMPREF1541_07000 [Cyphellophora europaea CBS 101466]ETN38958.1 hypothetical protein HMPREF1541_07000 [Cyphellophora europaea CBS 101466]